MFADRALQAALDGNFQQARVAVTGFVRKETGSDSPAVWRPIHRIKQVWVFMYGQFPLVAAILVSDHHRSFIRYVERPDKCYASPVRRERYVTVYISN